jgi:hypothetical protein
MNIKVLNLIFFAIGASNYQTGFSQARCPDLLRKIEYSKQSQGTAALHGTSVVTLDVLLSTSALPVGQDHRIYFAPNPENQAIKNSLARGQIDKKGYAESVSDSEEIPYDILLAFETSASYSQLLAQRSFFANRLNVDLRDEIISEALDSVLMQNPKDMPGQFSISQKNALIKEAQNQKGVVLGFDEASLTQYPVKTAYELNNQRYDEGLAYISPDGIAIKHLTAIWTFSNDQKKAIERKLKAKGINVPVYLLNSHP